MEIVVVNALVQNSMDQKNKNKLFSLHIVLLEMLALSPCTVCACSE
uniref:Uncharacterized protein n=1 Tax=Anguilla anguilla TaxID=7936 RepID=A0A0E9S407_ANGAN